MRYATLIICHFLLYFLRTTTTAPFSYPTLKPYGGSGRFPCSTKVNGRVTVNANACSNAKITSLQSPICNAQNDPYYGKVDIIGYKNYGYIPVNSVCQQDPNDMDSWYCGYLGAPFVLFLVRSLRFQCLTSCWFSGAILPTRVPIALATTEYAHLQVFVCTYPSKESVATTYNQYGATLFTNSEGDLALHVLLTANV